MTTPGHDGEHGGGAMDRTRSAWRDPAGARDDHQDAGQAWGGQQPPGGTQPGGNTVPVAYQGPQRIHGPAQPAGPPPQQGTPRSLPQMVSRDGEHDSGPDGRQAPEPTVVQAVPWQAPRPMSQPTSPPQLAPQQTNPRPLQQRSAPQPLPQRPGPQPVPQPLPQAVPPPAPQPLPQRSAPPQLVRPESGNQPVSAQPAPAQPAPAAADVPGRKDADPPITWEPAAATTTDDRTESAQPVSPRTAAEPATADPTGPRSAPAAAPEPPSVREEAADQELDDDSGEESADDQGPTSEAVPAQPAQPVRRSVWTEPEAAAPRPSTGADRADTPDRPMSVLRPVPAVPDRAPNRIPGILPSHIPSHITDAAAGVWTRQQNGASTRPQGRHELFDAPYREAEPMPDLAPVPSSPSRVAAGPPPADTPPATSQRFVPEDRATAFADRWNAVKSEFVDEPREAVRKADTLVGELLADIARALAEQRAQLDRGLDTDSTSTEDLRLAMHRYREFFDRLLTL